MEREISSGAMLGIVLLALAAVIGLGFGVFAIAKGIANEGTVGVQDSLGTVSTQVFLDYDQKVITGTQAVSAIKTFEGKPYAVIVSTKALRGDQGIEASRGTTSPAYLVTIGSDKYINYNAVLASSSAGALPQQVSGTAPNNKISTVTPSGSQIVTLTSNNGTYTAPFGFALNGTDVKFDSLTGGVFKSGNAEFIPSQTKFQANIIKDSSGSILGVALKQI